MLQLFNAYSLEHPSVWPAADAPSCVQSAVDNVLQPLVPCSVVSLDTSAASSIFLCFFCYEPNIMISGDQLILDR